MPFTAQIYMKLTIFEYIFFDVPYTENFFFLSGRNK